MDAQAFIVVLALIVLGFIFFAIYFIFKILQFVIQAINLYKDMVIRQDAMLKILKDIRNVSSGVNNQHAPDIEVTTLYEDDPINTESQDETPTEFSPQEMQKMYDNGECPECGCKINKSQERCLECDVFLIKYMS